MNEPRQIFNNTMVLAISKVVERASTTFLGFFVARRLGAAALGVYTAAMVYYSVVFLAAGMGSTSFLVREIAKYRDQTSRYVVHLSAMVTTAAVLAISASMLLIPQLGYSPDMASSVYLVIIAILPGALNSIQEAVFVAHQRVEFITYTSIIAAIVNVGISLWLLVRGHGIVSLVAAFVVVQYVVTLCYFGFIRQYIVRLHFEFDFAFAGQLFREIRPFAASSVLSGIFARPEVIILSFFRNEAQVGYYSAALKLVDLWSVIPQIYMTNVFPLLSRSYYLGDKKFGFIRDKSIKYLVAVSLPIAAGVMVAGRPIVAVMYGPGFGPTVPVLRILAWTIPLISLFAVAWRVLAARGEQGLVTNVQVITTVIRLAGGYALIWWLAALGGAITVSATMLIHTTLLLFYIQRDGTRMPVFRLMWRFGVAALCMGAATYFLGARFHLWQLVAAAVVIYGIMVVALRAFSRDDLELFRKVMQVKTASRAFASPKNNAAEC